MKKNQIFTILFAHLFFITSSFASPISIQLKGIVTQVDSIYSPLVSLGDSMTASFEYDYSLVNQAIEFGPDRYFYYSTLLSYEVSIGKIIASGLGGRSEVTNNYIDQNNRLWDRFILETGGVSYPHIPALENLFDINTLSVGMVFYDFIDADALTTSDSPQNILLSSFDINQSYVSIQMDLKGEPFIWQPMFARLTSAEIISAPEVPIPPSFSLFASGLLYLFTLKKPKAKYGDFLYPKLI
jgi:hypothetical protein